MDLSKHTFEARKENELLKTQIRLGEDDLILLVKHKGDRDWEVEPNMFILGPIREPEWHKLWPAPSVPDLQKALIIEPKKLIDYHLIAHLTNLTRRSISWINQNSQINLSQINLTYQINLHNKINLKSPRSLIINTRSLISLTDK